MKGKFGGSLIIKTDRQHLYSCSNQPKPSTKPIFYMLQQSIWVKQAIHVKNPSSWCHKYIIRWRMDDAYNYLMFNE
eukprot:Gb_20930 [translate_table: standard]